MTKNHLKTRSAPRTWNIARKVNTFITRPNPGGQSMEMTLPLGQVLKELQIGTTKKELNFILKNHSVLVNGTRRWDVRFPVGFQDVVSVSDLKKHSVLTMDEKGRLAAQPVEENHSGSKLAQVRGASKVRGDKIQLHLSDGRNLLVKETMKAGTTVVVSFKDNKIVSSHPVEAKANVILTAGKHRGKRGTIESFDEGFVTVSTAKGSISTKKAYAFVLGGAA